MTDYRRRRYCTEAQHLRCREHRSSTRTVAALVAVRAPSRRLRRARLPPLGRFAGSVPLCYPSSASRLGQRGAAEPRRDPRGSARVLLLIVSGLHRDALEAVPAWQRLLSSTEFARDSLTLSLAAGHGSLVHPRPRNSIDYLVNVRVASGERDLHVSSLHRSRLN